MTAEEITELRQRRYNATVVSLKLLNPDLMVLRVKPDFPRPPHHPGQYCTLGLGYWERRTERCQVETLAAGEETKVVRRAYSISSSILDESGHLMRPEDNDWLEFYIVLVRENADGRVPALTPRLFGLSEGDRIQIGERITGHYTLDPVKAGDTVIFLGTGTGEAPHNYMTWELLSRGHTGKVVNACCVRYGRDLGYHDTHKKLMSQFPNYTYLALTTREPGVTRKVYIQDLITSGELEERIGEALDPAKTHVFLCGNPKMIGVPHRDRETGTLSYPQPVGVIEVLEARGFKADIAAVKLKGNVHFEEYW
ncbi:ferredoxin--nadp reductase : Probable ferredoxin--NADP reductase OS=Planctomyces maris DSM 8797 GN=PM8797T_00487 PE=4 SV=1: NAD_binding_1 [Gemmata massiliana]|uniref:ferredoxin--NADP(+) reductase n=1 Tax=Gemmata massiliana TaxID=1210884 RepID=A0A6P2D1F6_9BACT|nr:ferredoxin--NADP reductase [Gemmata massiliana]VTR94953.1 ferredoxin--nadp reductase : Probable ferredoxin--NADP reductase OS=Planctomyces maris DSM 8797 GN=PM8797T_00487 PE=4 SV=1: NAD_binding_1 [Gemmata massiliana]